MYLNYFGLNAEPFSIAPNPQMLYPSARHQEAIAYLKYGLRGTGGFVMLTGEVGTGKTMVSRAVLTDLNDSFNVAYILNPSLNSLELLQSVCENFDIEIKGETTHKMMSDALQAFLIDQHAKDRQCLLVIDEAQHLSKDSLEQLRLFTNLETNHKKLLQIILIGQPELQEKLNTRELRQLAQRITARYHLLPLTEREMIEYVLHRLASVGCLHPVFSKKALKVLFKLTKGTPRLVNLIADRAMMGAYSNNQSTISDKMIMVAGREVLGQEVIENSHLSIYLIFVSVLLLILFAIQ